MNKWLKIALSITLGTICSYGVAQIMIINPIGRVISAYILWVVIAYILSGYISKKLGV